MRRIRFIALLALALSLSAGAYGQSKAKKDVNALAKIAATQKKGKAGKGGKAETLSRTTLDKATSVLYYRDNGSVPPEYYYHYTITVTKQTVQLVIKKGESRKVTYSERADITRSQYEQFVNKLSSQGIKKTKDRTIAEGSGLSAIKVGQNTAVLFSGHEGDDISIAHGRLADAFLQILPPKMKQQITALN